MVPDIDPAGGKFLHQFSVIRVRRYTQFPLSYGCLDKDIAFYLVYVFFSTATNLTQLKVSHLQIPSYSTGIAVPYGLIQIKALKFKDETNINMVPDIRLGMDAISTFLNSDSEYSWRA